MRAACSVMVLSLVLGCGGTDPAPPATSPEPHCGAPVPHPLDDSLRMFHLQAKSTHNSYHLEPPDNAVGEWSYSLAPLDVQLGAQGVRHFELDVHLDAEQQVFEVYHFAPIDEETTCRRLGDCVRLIKDWSAQNPGHHPIFVHLEPKDGITAEPEAYFALLERELTSVWARECIVTPARVQGSRASLAQAVATDGWPALADARGKIMFTLLDRAAWRDLYTRDRDNVDGRLLFAEGDPGEPYAAITRVDDPIGGADALAAALAAGMMVRTRADSGSKEPLAADTARKEAALGSGAHLVSTDYPAPVPDIDYWLDIPGGTPSRCNPVTAPASCSSTAVEDPAKLK